MKFLLTLSVLGFGLVAQAQESQSRCTVEVNNAMVAQTQIDFPNRQVIIILPDMGQEQVLDTYTVDVADKFSLQLIGRYEIMVGETCQIMSGPTRI